MNSRHLLAIVLAVAAINIGISLWSGNPLDFTSIRIASSVAAFLGGLFWLFDGWLWRVPFLHPWFVAVPCIRGEWKIKGNISLTKPNQTTMTAGTIDIKQTYFSIKISIKWEDDAQTRFLSKVPIVAREDGFCAFVAIYEFDPKKDGENPATRTAGFFFHCDQRRPKEFKVFYSTSDRQVGSFEVSNSQRMRFQRWLARY